MKTIATVCQKGGVGKTTTAINLGAGLARKGNRVLFVDLDAQGNLTDTLGGKSSNLTSYEVLTQTASAKDAIQTIRVGDLIPAGPKLSWADTEVTSPNRESRLRNALEAVQGNYDYVIVDTPPALGILTVNALTSATQVLVTVQADAYSLRSIGQLSLTIDAIRQHCNPTLAIGGILLTRHNSRSILSRDMVEMIEQTAAVLHTKVFATKIREAIAIKESQARQQDIFSYAPKSGAAADYQEFINEYLAGNKI